MEGISSALDESDRMARIVHNLMTISRLDGGGERIEMKPLELTGILKTTLDHMSLLADEKGIEVRCEATGPVWVTGDAMRLKQVIVNLVDNAIKYTAKGGLILVRLQARNEAGGNGGRRQRHWHIQRVVAASCLSAFIEPTRRGRANPGEQGWGWPSSRPFAPLITARYRWRVRRTKDLLFRCSCRCCAFHPER